MLPPGPQAPFIWVLALFSVSPSGIKLWEKENGLTKLRFDKQVGFIEKQPVTLSEEKWVNLFSDKQVALFEGQTS